MFRFDTTLFSTINFMTMAFDYLNYVTSTKLKKVNDKNVKPVSHLILKISFLTLFGCAVKITLDINWARTLQCNVFILTERPQYNGIDSMLNIVRNAFSVCLSSSKNPENWSTRTKKFILFLYLKKSKSYSDKVCISDLTNKYVA